MSRIRWLRGPFLMEVDLRCCNVFFPSSSIPADLLRLMLLRWQALAEGLSDLQHRRHPLMFLDARVFRRSLFRSRPWFQKLKKSRMLKEMPFPLRKKIRFPLRRCWRQKLRYLQPNLRKPLSVVWTRRCFRKLKILWSVLQKPCSLWRKQGKSSKKSRRTEAMVVWELKVVPRASPVQRKLKRIPASTAIYLDTGLVILSALNPVKALDERILLPSDRWRLLSRWTRSTWLRKLKLSMKYKLLRPGLLAIPLWRRLSSLTWSPKRWSLMVGWLVTKGTLELWIRLAIVLALVGIGWWVFWKLWRVLPLRFSHWLPPKMSGRPFVLEMGVLKLVFKGGVFLQWLVECFFVFGLRWWRFPHLAFCLEEIFWKV